MAHPQDIVVFKACINAIDAEYGSTEYFCRYFFHEVKPCALINHIRTTSSTMTTLPRTVLLPLRIKSLVQFLIRHPIRAVKSIFFLKLSLTSGVDELWLSGHSLMLIEGQKLLKAAIRSNKKVFIFNRQSINTSKSNFSQFSLLLFWCLGFRKSCVYSQYKGVFNRCDYQSARELRPQIPSKKARLSRIYFADRFSGIQAFSDNLDIASYSKALEHVFIEIKKITGSELIYKPHPRDLNSNLFQTIAKSFDAIAGHDGLLEEMLLKSVGKAICVLSTNSGVLNSAAVLGFKSVCIVKLAGLKDNQYIDLVESKMRKDWGVQIPSTLEDLKNALN